MLETLEKNFKSISLQDKVAFFSAMIFGLFAHYFAITTKITNHDDIRETISEQDQIFFGRWFKAVASDISGDYSMTFNCLLGLVYIAIAAVLIIKLLKIRSTIVAGIAGAFLTTFPSITFNNLYQGTADVYALDILLTVIGTYIAVKAKNKIVAIIVPVVLMTLGLGIYQAYLGVALGIFVIVGLADLVYEKASFKSVLLSEIRYLITAVLSLICYLMVQKIVTAITGITMDSYQGIDKMGTIDFAMLPYQLRLAMVKPLGFFIKNDKAVHYEWLSYLFIVLIVYSLVIFGLHIVNERLGKLELALSFVLLLCLPIAAGFIYLEGANQIHLLILYGIVVLPLFIMLIIDRAECSFKSYTKIYQGLGILVFALVIFNYITLANAVYTIDYYIYEESYSYAQTIASEIRRTPGYSQDSTIYMIGYPASKAGALDEFYAEDPRTREFADIGLDRDFNAEYSVSSFYWYYLGLTNPIKVIDNEEKYGLNPFPDENSISSLDGNVYIRFE